MCKLIISNHVSHASGQRSSGKLHTRNSRIQRSGKPATRNEKHEVRHRRADNRNINPKELIPAQIAHSCIDSNAHRRIGNGNRSLVYPITVAVSILISLFSSCAVTYRVNPLNYFLCIKRFNAVCVNVRNRPFPIIGKRKFVVQVQNPFRVHCRSHTEGS